jgi:hypothetical protein
MAVNTPGFDFASRDYENIRRDLLNRAALVAPEWTDRDPSDFGVLLVDLWAYMGDVLHYYIDRAAGEAFITTATQRESMLALANLFDYTPYSRRPASAIVYVSNTSSASVSLPAGTGFVGSSELGNINFFSDDEVLLNAGDTNVPVFVTEGSIITEEILTNSSSGRPNQRYSLSKLNVVSNNVQVYVYEDGVNATPWNQVVDVAVATINTSSYSVSVNADNETQILFGTSLAGRVPPNNTKITATYSVTSGADGNIPAGNITSFRTSQPTGVAITGSTAATGGSSGESIESIKASLKATIKSQDRAVIINDFVDLALRIPNVYRATVAYQPDAAGGGSVTVYAMPFISNYESYSLNTVTVDTDVKNQIVSSIQPLSMLGVTVLAAPQITLVPKTIEADIYVDSSYVNNAVKNAVSNALDGLFDLGSLEFGEDLRIGDVYKTIHDIEGVLYATVTLTGDSPTNTQLIRKGAFDLTPIGGITTTI